jgi:nitrite reductase/ring-hydroxylating ferredoxin subunit/ferredoxin-thioredoxin reductase catalytic subunit
MEGRDVDDAPVRRRFDKGTTADDLKALMAPFVGRLGYKFNTDTEFVDATLEAELGILEETGDVYCPCRMRSGDPKADAAIVCPCIPLHLDEFAAMNKCWCGLFVRTGIRDGSTLHGITEAPPGPIDVRVAAVDDLHDGEGRRVKVGKRDIALFRVEGSYFALSNLCRHAFAPLAEGYLDGHIVMCPWHGWRYDVRDGTTDHPDADVRVFPVTVRDGEVFVTVDS